MKSIICTLFEGHYHIGVAVLVNSLYKQGFKGDIYAGYKGILPVWASSAKKNTLLLWSGVRTLDVAEGLKLHFLPIDTEFHLTNYKPYFMLSLLKEVDKLAYSVTYFDPDIVIKCNWKYFESWMSHGVALVHEISSNDMPPTHPLRMEWNKVINDANRKITRSMYSYINGGFCGVTRKNIEFIEAWIDITNTAIKYHNLKSNQWDHDYDRTYMFYAQDQDALNITAMCSVSPISEMGPEAMDFVHGGFTMSHCTGSPKPWRKNFILSSLKGTAPSLSDKAFWANVDGPLNIYSSNILKFKQMSLMVGSLIGRFYSKK